MNLCLALSSFSRSAIGWSAGGRDSWYRLQDTTFTDLRSVEFATRKVRLALWSILGGIRSVIELFRVLAVGHDQAGLGIVFARRLDMPNQGRSHNRTHQHRTNLPEKACGACVKHVKRPELESKLARGGRRRPPQTRSSLSNHVCGFGAVCAHETRLVTAGHSHSASLLGVLILSLPTSIPLMPPPACQKHCSFPVLAPESR